MGTTIIFFFFFFYFSARFLLVLFRLDIRRLDGKKLTFKKEQHSSLLPINHKQIVVTDKFFKMVIFMPYYRQHGEFLHSHARNRPSSSSSNGQHNTTAQATVHMSACKFASSMLCRFTFSLFLFAIALFLFQLSINNLSNKKEGSNIIAVILLTIAIVSFLRTCQTLRRYLTIMQTRRRLIQVKKKNRICLISLKFFSFFLFRDYVKDNKLMI